MRKGKSFENKIQNALKKKGFVYKFRDYAVNPRGAYKVPVPADFLFLCCNHTFFLECKEFRGDRFYFKNIRDKQLDYAEQVTKQGIRYYFLIHHVQSDRLHIVKYEEIQRRIEDGARSISERTLQLYPTLQMGTRYGGTLLNVLFAEIR